VPIVVALGWVMPLFGIPLAVFLVADIEIGAVRGRRGRSEILVSSAPAGS
jgi:hypothetical protein